jgi:hypothetical protein
MVANFGVFVLEDVFKSGVVTGEGVMNIWSIRGNWRKFHSEEFVLFSKSGRLLYPTADVYGGIASGNDIRYLSDKIMTLYIRGCTDFLKKVLTISKFQTPEG